MDECWASDRNLFMCEDSARNLARQVTEEVVATLDTTRTKGWELYRGIATIESKALAYESPEEQARQLKLIAEFCLLAAECFDDVCDDFSYASKLSQPDEDKDEDS